MKQEVAREVENMMPAERFLHIMRIHKTVSLSWHAHTLHSEHSSQGRKTTNTNSNTWITWLLFHWDTKQKTHTHNQPGPQGWGVCWLAGVVSDVVCFCCVTVCCSLVIAKVTRSLTCFLLVHWFDWFGRARRVNAWPIITSYVCNNVGVTTWPTSPLKLIQLSELFSKQIIQFYFLPQADMSTHVIAVNLQGALFITESSLHKENALI